uniref:Uncharacterized protein n=1 Tax=Romanomermis culicivorax TaxID=13658 RepID=A0A915I5Z3_ROMCU
IESILLRERDPFKQKWDLWGGLGVIAEVTVVNFGGVGGVPMPSLHGTSAKIMEILSEYLVMSTGIHAPEGRTAGTLDLVIHQEI